MKYDDASTTERTARCFYGHARRTTPNEPPETRHFQLYEPPDGHQPRTVPKAASREQPYDSALTSLNTSAPRPRHSGLICYYNYSCICNRTPKEVFADTGVKPTLTPNLNTLALIEEGGIFQAMIV
ncbi:uncharacterized protein LOC127148775 [Cucumis melo]|uniref:Uncharacterized protein LOC127148775 n=1 Tax=Cucumis melo TaxID=3656 RepID=A0ABM3KMK8_CUCME|nr:uncharacterized protein LOC127148775 [Cucumis melo]XP_050939025.1 uncharacterized protein LOC127148775 [Cucumis melo]